MSHERIRPRLLRVNTSWALIGNIGYSAGLWGLTILIAKLSGTEVLGRYALATAIATPIVLVSRLHLRGVQATDIAEEFRFGHYVALRIAASIAAFLLILLIPFFTNLSSEMVVLVWILGLFKLGEGGSDILYGYLQRHERLDLITHSLLIHAVGMLGISALVLWWSGDLVLTIAAMLAVRLVILGGVDIPLVQSIAPASTLSRGTRWGDLTGIRPIWDRSTILRLMIIAAPLGIAMMLVTLKEMMPRYVLASAQSEADLGTYVALAYFVSVGGLGVNAVGQAVQPRLAAYAADKAWSQFWRLLSFLLVCAVGLCVVAVASALLFGGRVLEIIYTPEIATYRLEFAWVLGAGTLGYCSSLLGYALTATRRFQIQVPAYALGLVTTAVTAMLWIPSNNLIGASWAIGVGTLVQAGALAAALLKRDPPSHAV